MKICPYCRRRISYSAIYKNKKHGSYTCENCKKESKVKVNNAMLILFAALCLLVALFMIFWVGAGLSNNFWGVVIVATLLLAFNFATPAFINFVPLKKYKNDIAGKKTLEEKIDVDSIGDSNFVFNREAFDKIKRQKELGMMNAQNFDVEDEISSNRENFVPVIEDVKEGHISSSDAPLHKINRQPRQYENIYADNITESEEEVKRYTPKKKKSNGSRYTANRKF